MYRNTQGAMTRSDGASGRMCHGLPAANFRVTLSAKSRLVPDSNAAETPRRCVSVCRTAAAVLGAQAPRRLTAPG